MKKRVLCFLMAMLVFVSSPMTVHASSGIPFVTDMANQVLMSGADIGNRLRLFCEQIGLWLSPDKWGDGNLFDLFGEYMTEKALIQTADDYDEYLQSHLTITEDENGEYEYSADSDMMNTLYDFSQDLINDCGWYECRTTDYRNVSSTIFDSHDLYNAFISYCEKNIKGTDNIVFRTGCPYEKDSQGNVIFFCPLSAPLENLEFYVRSYISGNKGFIAYITQDWTTLTCSLYKLYDSGITETVSVSKNYCYIYYDEFIGEQSDLTPITDGSRIVRVYKTLDDLKMYSVGQRPYYTTNEYYNYNSSVDNSTTINQTTIDNSVAYGDVYNYITNNYENPDGLTEDQLRDILDDYLDEIKNNQNNNSGGSGSSGSDDSGSSGGGLGSFLTGLGSLGDAILGILGKLIEYIGKAVDLIVNGISGIIEKIPTSITSLMATAFPFLPEEFFTAIELALILGVVCVVIKIFK